MKINIKYLKKILKFKKNEYKYLSPHVYKDKKLYILLYCNRGNPSAISGELNSAESLNLNKWVKTNETVISKFYKKKYHSFVSPCIAKIKNKFFLFVEAQYSNFFSDIICFESINNQWKLNKKFKLKSSRYNYKSPFFFQYKKKNFLFFSKNQKTINSLQLSNDLKIIKENVCFKKEFLNEKYSIYSPSVIKISSKLHMFYAAWSNATKGNINYAYSLDGLNWVKKYKNIFQTQKKIKIISEPFVILIKNIIYIFFEYRDEDKKWNIAYKKFSKNRFNLILK